MPTRSPTGREVSTFDTGQTYWGWAHGHRRPQRPRGPSVSAMNSDWHRAHVRAAMRRWTRASSGTSSTRESARAARFPPASSRRSRRAGRRHLRSGGVDGGRAQRLDEPMALVGSSSAGQPRDGRGGLQTAPGRDKAWCVRGRVGGQLTRDLKRSRCPLGRGTAARGGRPPLQARHRGAVVQHHVDVPTALDDRRRDHLDVDRVARTVVDPRCRGPSARARRPVAALERCASVGQGDVEQGPAPRTMNVSMPTSPAGSSKRNADSRSATASPAYQSWSGSHASADRSSTG